MNTFTFSRSETIEYVIEQNVEMQVTACKVDKNNHAQSTELLSLGVMYDIMGDRGRQQLVDKLNDIELDEN